MEDMESLNKQEIGFLKEQITDLKHEMTAGFAKLEAKLEILAENYVRRGEVRELLVPIRSDIDDLKEDRKWIVRIIIGLIITAVIGAVIVTK